MEIDDGLITESKRRLCVCVKSKAVINLDGLFGAAGQQNDKRRYTAPLKRNPEHEQTDGHFACPPIFSGSGGDDHPSLGSSV